MSYCINSQLDNSLYITIHTGVLILGNTGKVITPAHENSGVATVAALALAKLLVPLKHLKIDDTEYALLKEIVLFNPGECLMQHFLYIK